MKTSEILDKYRKIISAILNCKPEEIKFFIKDRGEGKDKTIWDEIGNLTYTKDNNWSLGYYKVELHTKKIKKQISNFRLYKMPHCCAYMISCDVSVYAEFRNKRIGTILNQLRQDIGRLLGYSSFLCTDIEQNTNQRKLLATNGFKDIHNVVNKRTQNRVYLSVINL